MKLLKNRGFKIASKLQFFFLLLFPVHMLSDLAMLVQFSTFSKCFIHLTYFLALKTANLGCHLLCCARGYPVCRSLSILSTTSTKFCWKGKHHFLSAEWLIHSIIVLMLMVFFVVIWVISGIISPILPTVLSQINIPQTDLVFEYF